RLAEPQPLSRVKGFEPLASLFHARLVRDRGDEELLRDAIDHLVFGGEDERALLAVSVQQLREHAQLRVRAERDAFRFTISEHRAAARLAACGRSNKSLPAIQCVQL